VRNDVVRILDLELDSAVGHIARRSAVGASGVLLFVRLETITYNKSSTTTTKAITLE